MMDDTELLRRYATEGSEAAFTELVRRHLDIVFSAACRQMGGDAHRAQDVAQMVFADLARKASSLAGHTALIGWLYTSTHYAAAKVKRAEMRRVAREQEAHAMEEILGVPEVAADWDRLHPVLDAAMHDLDQRDRAAVLLRFFEKRTFADVGRALGLGENAARMRVERALEKLGGLLAKRGVTSTATALALVLTNQAVAAAPGGMVQTVATGALGQAALGGMGLTATLIQFMSTTKFTAAAAGLAGLLALGGSVFYAQQAAAAERTRAALGQEADGWAARLRQVNGRIATLEVARTAAAGNVAAPVAPAESAAPQTDAEKIMHALLTDPQLMELRARQEAGEVGRQFGPFFRAAGLSPAQAAQFEARIQQALLESHRAQSTGRIKGAEFDLGPAENQRLAQARADFERDIKGMFGDGVLQQYLRYEREATAHDIAAKVASQVYFTSTPLASSQAAELARIIVAHAPPEDPSGAISNWRIKWDEVLTEARATLSPVQLAALGAVRARIEYDKKLGEMNDAPAERNAP